MNDFTGIDTDTLNYFPLQSGKVPASSVGMKRISTLPEERQSIFQIDKWTGRTLKRKVELEQAHRNKHFGLLQRGRLSVDDDMAALYTVLVKHLIEEYPSFFTYSYDRWQREVRLSCLLTGDVLHFSKRRNGLYYNFCYKMADSDDLAPPMDARKTNRIRKGFEALAMQVPEDLVFYARDGDSDIGRVAWAHLMSAADWSVDWAIGKSFTQIHAKVRKADNSPIIKHPPGMVKGIMKMREPVERVGAISFRTCYKQNLHPDIDPEYSWTFDDEQELYIRFERQTVTPVPDLNGFLFTIRPYYANLLNPKRIDKAIEALENIDDNSYYRNLLQERGDDIVAFLKDRRGKYEKLDLL